MTSRTSPFATARARQGFILLWAALFVLSLLAQYNSFAAPQGAFAAPQGAFVAPPGNNGNVKVNAADDLAGGPENDPHVCAFFISGTNFDPQQAGSWWIETWPPTGSGETVLSDSYSANDKGDWQSGVINLADGHYKLYWQGVGDTSQEVKHKVFSVSCPPPAQAAQLTVTKHVVDDGGGDADASDFTMTVHGLDVVEPGSASFPGSEDGTTLEVKPGSYSVTELGPSGFQAVFSAGCTGTIAAGDAKECTVTNTWTDVETPSASITKSNDTTGPVAPGTMVTYTITVTVQNGPMNATVVDTLPTGWGTPTDITSPGSLASGKITWVLTGLTTGPTVLHYRAAVPVDAAAGSRHTNTAQIQGCELSTCTATSTVTIRTSTCQELQNCPTQPCTSACGSTSVASTPGLTLTKGVSLNQGGPFVESLSTTAGSTIWYQVVVTNPGDGGIGGLSITDTLGWPASCPVIPNPFAAKATYTCTYSRSAVEGITVNTATAIGAGLTASDSATVTVKGGVSGAIATPKPLAHPAAQPTLPPTDSLDRRTMSSSGMNLGSILILLSGLGLVLWILAPVSTRVRRRDHRS